MSSRELPAHPNLEHLKNQARKLLRQHLAMEPEALALFAASGINQKTPKFADALHVTAREYGFDTWPALKLQVEIGSNEPLDALSAAIKADRDDMVRAVLARGPELKARINEPLPNYGFDTPAIVAAAQRGNRRIVDLLLDFGADIDQRTRWWAGGFGVLDFAGVELAGYLISRGATVDIHAAARLGLTDRVRELLAHSPQLVNARGGDGQLPLHFAATVEIAAILLHAGADIDARDIDHESTAAQYMVAHQPYRQEVARYLLSRGARTDILMAAALGDLALVEQIVNHDPETIRITVGERYFPKQDPRSGGHIYIYGFGWTKSPHMIAHQFGHSHVFAFLMQRSPAWLRLINAAEVGDEGLFRRILDGQPDLFRRLSSNAARRIIGVAARNNAVAMRILLGAGWPADAVADTGHTALHFAAWHGNAEMVRQLLTHHAHVDVYEMEHGGSPLGWTLHGSQHSWARESGNYPAVARALLDAGAKIPVSEASLEAAEEVLEVLREHADSPQGVRSEASIDGN
ncbi:MAG TPA: ankyrin repeat domain-containing protein [Acidobacteriaceae bacterium]|nr:ankyrin repeat domain-containing protein [Acidobacteriaceae bacterium]